MASLITRRLFHSSVRLQAKNKADLKRETKRNPELMILGGVMAAALGGAGFYFCRTPTSSTSEVPVPIAEAGMPWEAEGEDKYKYYPGGDPKQQPKDAPSALNVVVVPNVTLPKELHDKFNKWGKDGYP